MIRPVVLTDSIIATFHKHVEVKGPDDCWPYWGLRSEGYKGGPGYGLVGKKHYRSNRVAWTIAKGPIPKGQIILHDCDNPPCCNPNHLVCGTFMDNSRDASKKGRMKHSIESRQAQSERQKGRVIPQEVRDKISESLKGNIISAEQRIKQSLSMTGRKKSEETKQRMRHPHKHYAKCVRSEEHTRKLREHTIAMNKSESHKIKVSIARKRKIGVI